MATIEQGNALIERFNVATNAIAATLRSLRDQLAAGGMTVEQEADFVARLGTAATALEALGANPENPVP